VHNAPGSLVISGTAAPVTAIASRLTARGLRTQRLTVSHAFHSPLMAPMLEEFRRVAAAVEHAEPRLSWISNLDGRALGWTEWGHRMGDYWCRHVREAVEFGAGVRALAALGFEAGVEIGPHPTLISLAQQTLAAARAGSGAITWHPSLWRRKNAVEVFVESVARLHLRGARIDWAAFTRSSERRSVRLPLTPFQRQRFILDYKAPARRTLRAGRAANKVAHELLGIACRWQASARSSSAPSPRSTRRGWPTTA
jgi:acyl transferase domain-containing protein